MPSVQRREGVPAAAIDAALAALCPERYGFRAHGTGWVIDDPAGAVAIAPLAWPHAHLADAGASGGEGTPRQSALAFLVDLQARTWGMPPAELVPANLLAVLADGGGSVLAAYDPRFGFNERGWLGFAIALGGRGGTLVSHMLGVREDIRGARQIGWRLKLIQGYEAVRAGHGAATWTFDPMRGANARLNLEKLGARADGFALDKYGALRSALYGEVPSDRLVVRWDLLAPETAARLADVAAGRYRGPTPAEVIGVPDATPENVAPLRDAGAPCLRYRIPADVDALARRDPDAAARWRREMRAVLAALLPTTRAAVDPAAGADPTRIGVRAEPGAFAVVGFASGADPLAPEGRSGFYLLERLAPADPAATPGGAR